MAYDSLVVPRFAIIAGHRVERQSVAQHLGGGEPVVLCVSAAADASAPPAYVTLTEWLAGSRAYAEEAAAQGIVTSASPSAQKLDLYRSLFRGRPDAFAHGYRTRDGGIGYAPVCDNEWKRGVCPKRSNHHFKCGDCNCRALRPPAKQDYLDHFRGNRPDLKDVMGLFVLDSACNTWILAADFDGDGWQEECRAYVGEARKLGLHPAVERSRSGDGGHVWIFFDEPISATKARNLGSAIITRAMRGGALKFSAYDRLFPTQDTVTKDGFGNLIALPFQGQAMRAGNSLFVDDDFQPYADQWRFLSGVQRASLEQVNAALKEFGGKPLGELFGASSEAEERPVVLSHVKLTAADFPQTVRITLSNRVYVPKEGLSAAAQNAIRRLAAFGNPEFYRAQAMHQSVYKKPRIIDIHYEDDARLGLPRGCQDRLAELLGGVGVYFTVDDRRSDVAHIDVEFTAELRPAQREAADGLLRYENGILSAPTGYGKTVIGTYLIGKLKARTLVIVPSTALIDQWCERIEQFLDIRETLPVRLTKSGKPCKRQPPVVGRLGGGTNKPSGIIDVATYQSLTEKGDVPGVRQVKAVVRNYDLVICDECHHGAAPLLREVLEAVTAHHVYGLSATPKRADGLEAILYMECGPVREVISPKVQMREQQMARVLVPRFTRVRIPSLEPGSSFNQILNKLCEHGERSRMIVDDVLAQVAHGHNPLVITKRVGHARKLAQALEEGGCRTFLLVGGRSSKEQKEVLARLHAVPEGQPFALVGTGPYIGEGFDDDRLDVMMLADPASAESVIVQYSGRLHRARPGKNEVRVFDYIDSGIPMLDRMYGKRLKTYRKLGYQVAPTDEAQGPAGRLVDATEFRPLLAEDVQRAERSVLIRSPFASADALRVVAPALVGAARRGLEVRICVGASAGRPYGGRVNQLLDSLRAAGCQVDTSPRRESSMAIVDEEVVWFGDVPPLGRAKPDDCSLRFVSAEVAADLA